MKEQTPLLGIFDSGVGGFSVLQELRKVTDTDIVYFGDCARAPYGNRGEAEIALFVSEILEQLQSKGVTHFVSACNSMSVNKTEKLLQESGIPKEQYIDMIDAVKLIPFEHGSDVLIVATHTTIASGLYQSILDEKGITASTHVPSRLAGEIEAQDSGAIEISINESIERAVAVGATHILYGCTHYPLVDVRFKTAAEMKGWKGSFIDPSIYVAQLVSRWKLEGTRSLRIETSKETPLFTSYSTKVW